MVGEKFHAVKDYLPHNECVSGANLSNSGQFPAPVCQYFRNFVPRLPVSPAQGRETAAAFNSISMEENKTPEPEKPVRSLNFIEEIIEEAVSYTHLTLPTN
jgi:hypothetical protein